MLLNKLYNDLTVTVERVALKSRNEWVVRLVCKEPNEDAAHVASINYGEIDPIDLTLRHFFDCDLKASKTADAVFNKAEINLDRWHKTNLAMLDLDASAAGGSNLFHACRSFEDGSTFVRNNNN